MTARAKVILKKSITYTFEGKRWIKDVPGIVHGEETVKLYKANGYFHTVDLEPKKDKKDKKKNKVSSEGNKKTSSQKKKSGGNKKSKAGGKLKK